MDSTLKPTVIFSSHCPLCQTHDEFTELLASLILAKKVQLGVALQVHCEECGKVDVLPEYDA